MIKKEEIESKAAELLDVLDAKKYPEVCDYLDFVSDAVDMEDTPLVIADTLVSSDVPKKFPKILIDFIEDLYQLVISEEGEDAAIAMNNLGAQYYDGGRGFEQDFGKAVHYYEMAAENGNRQAQENLGYCYYYGRNMPVDYEKAYQYFALGALDGHLISLYKIGDMYLNGYYVKKNEKEAFHIFVHCLEMMTEEAEKYVSGPVHLRLGKMFLNGLGTDRNAKSALICYQKAEAALYDMVKRGERMYEKSLQAAIDGQAQARIQLQKELQEED